MSSLLIFDWFVLEQGWLFYNLVGGKFSRYTNSDGAPLNARRKGKPRIWLLIGAWIQFLLTKYQREYDKPEVFVVQKRERVRCGEWNRHYQKMKFGSLNLYRWTIIDDNNGLRIYRCLPSWVQLVFPSPMKPSLQMHLYEPTVFWHSASLWQSFIKSLRHSSWSITKIQTTDSSAET